MPYKCPNPDHTMKLQVCRDGTYNCKLCYARGVYKPSELDHTGLEGYVELYQQLPDGYMQKKGRYEVYDKANVEKQIENLIELEGKELVHYYMVLNTSGAAVTMLVEFGMESKSKNLKSTKVSWRQGRKGRKHGVQTTKTLYHAREDGTKLWCTHKTNYYYGKLHGLRRKMWSNSQVQFEMYYEDGLPHGVMKEWWANGKLRGTCKFVKGKIEGEYKHWSIDGEHEWSNTYKNGVPDGVYRSYWPDGVIMVESSWQDGVMIGAAQWFDTKGNPYNKDPHTVVPWFIK